ncbi:Permease of the drug/metabolite transporter (DMT) superfamily [Paramagnetospirillum magnetotacticum MS-1]|uniref:Permease of the drug/metabolite transporter (DMT) superfamily n=1 Tax=Paramagnetospirillum magnetotacticum MS-1 TaxID=272627 RepID=A0A0C2YVV7_PARME|nr:DMT family transporter [Paramagnetospirillum magnetotacticum]KIL98845.1 Permease of the drug/metabolite transporter (DMT) superfamily [Paramagnetospirillum magnetotacticum MS-1]
MKEHAWTKAMPGVFVMLWSTGFIGAKYGLPYAEPFTFLVMRFIIVIALLGVVVGIFRAKFPSDPKLWLHLAVSGLLVHAVYLGGVFAAIRLGVPSGLTALVAGLQPLLTAAVVGPLLGEKVGPRQWGGLALGLIGVAMVLSTRLTGVRFDGFGWDGMAFAVAALLAITCGTLYQKRYCTGMDLRTGTLIQYLAALAVVGPAALATETMVVQWTLPFVLALGWLVLVLSLGAISLLMTLIRLGEAAKVASFFYLVPPMTALLAWALFDEVLTPLALGGMVATALGVALVVRK